MAPKTIYKDVKGDKQPLNDGGQNVLGRNIPNHKSNNGRSNKGNWHSPYGRESESPQEGRRPKGLAKTLTMRAVQETLRIGFG